MLNTVGRFIYTKYLEKLYFGHWEYLFTQNTGEYLLEHCGKIYLHKILGNIFCWTLLEDLFTQNNWEILYVEHHGKIYLHKILWNLYVEHCGKICLHTILGNTLCWTLLEDLFTQNTGKYFMLNTVGRFIYTKYWEKLSVVHCWKINLHIVTAFFDNLGRWYHLQKLQNSTRRDTDKWSMSIPYTR